MEELLTRIRSINNLDLKFAQACSAYYQKGGQQQALVAAVLKSDYAYTLSNGKVITLTAAEIQNLPEIQDLPDISNRTLDVVSENIDKSTDLRMVFAQRLPELRPQFINKSDIDNQDDQDVIENALIAKKKTEEEELNELIEQSKVQSFTLGNEVYIEKSAHILAKAKQVKIGEEAKQEKNLHPDQPLSFKIPTFNELRIDQVRMIKRNANAGLFAALQELLQQDGFEINQSLNMVATLQDLIYSKGIVADEQEDPVLNNPFLKTSAHVRLFRDKITPNNGLEETIDSTNINRIIF